MALSPKARDRILRNLSRWISTFNPETTAEVVRENGDDLLIVTEKQMIATTTVRLKVESIESITPTS